jgi:hypothetical protein
MTFETLSQRLAFVEKTLQECAAGYDPENTSVALQIVLQDERVPAESHTSTVRLISRAAAKQ